MSTYRVLSDILDFIEKKNYESMTYTAPDCEEVEVSHWAVSWKKTYPKVETPEKEEEEGDKPKKYRIDNDPRDYVSYGFNYYFDNDRKRLAPRHVLGRRLRPKPNHDLEVKSGNHVQSYSGNSIKNRDQHVGRSETPRCTRRALESGLGGHRAEGPYRRTSG